MFCATSHFPVFGNYNSGLFSVVHPSFPPLRFFCLGNRQTDREGVCVWLSIYINIYCRRVVVWNACCDYLPHPFSSIGSHLHCRTLVLNNSSYMCRSKIWTNVRQIWTKSHCVVSYIYLNVALLVHSAFWSLITSCMLKLVKSMVLGEGCLFDT